MEKVNPPRKQSNGVSKNAFTFNMYEQTTCQKKYITRLKDALQSSNAAKSKNIDNADAKEKSF